jgi:RNA polymerase primary sigma factor
LARTKRSKSSSSPRRLDEGSLNIYLKEIAKIPLLDKEEEFELALKARQGDAEAKEKLVSANLRFVVKVAKAYQSRGLSLVDLINEGNIGLLRAVTKFDERKSVRFISYAIWWIRQSILRAVAEQSKIVRLPMNKAERIRKVAEAARIIGQEMGREPTGEEIARKLGLDEKDVADALGIAKRDISLDVPATGGEGATISDMIESAVYPSPEEFMDREACSEEMEKAIKRLVPRPRGREAAHPGGDRHDSETVQRESSSDKGESPQQAQACARQRQTQDLSIACEKEAIHTGRGSKPGRQVGLPHAALFIAVHNRIHPGGCTCGFNAVREV